MLELLKQWKRYIIVFLVLVFLFAFLLNFAETSRAFLSAFNFLFYISEKLIIGLCIAYVINFMVGFLSKRLRFPRWLAVTASYLFLFGVVTWLVIYIIPLMAESINKIMQVAEQTYNGYDDLMSALPEMMSPSLAVVVVEFAEGLKDGVFNFLKGLDFDFFQDLIISSTRAIVNIIFGVLISIYVVISKDQLIDSIKTLLKVIIPKKYGRISEVASESHRLFSHFLMGKLVESTIVGLLAYIAFKIFNMPLAPFMAFITGVTNMIPVLGPIIGGAITVVVMLCYDPVFAIYAIIIAIVVQTLEMLILSPKILGDAVGLSPLFTVVAIAIGGDIGGFFGMFLAVPLLAVFRNMFYRGFINKRRVLVGEASAGGGASENMKNDNTAEAAGKKEKNGNGKNGKNNGS